MCFNFYSTTGFRQLKFSENIPLMIRCLLNKSVRIQWIKSNNLASLYMKQSEKY